ncbi:hypothetical protein Droror1_Dr00015181 [Drosera rotundifolia]
MWSCGEEYPCAITATSSSLPERGEGTRGLGETKGIEQKSMEAEAVVLVSGWGMRRRVRLESSSEVGDLVAASSSGCSGIEASLCWCRLEVS